MDQPTAQHIHRRKSSKDEDENFVIAPPLSLPLSSTPSSSKPRTDPSLRMDAAQKTNGLVNGIGHTPFPTQQPQFLAAPPPPRNRVHSSPASHSRSMSTTSVFPSGPPPTSPFRPSFNFGRPNPNAINGINGLSPASPFRPSFHHSPASSGHGGHSRTRSISAFAPSSPSPLAVSFPMSASTNDAVSSTTQPTSRESPTSPSSLSDNVSPATSPTLPGLSSAYGRRHSRLNSRNLSVFFPRPGSLPASAIAEDGAQELELGGARSEDQEAAASSDDMSSSPPSGQNGNWRAGRRSVSLRGPPTPLGVGFTFGSRPPTQPTSSSAAASPNSSSLPIPPPMMAPSLSSSSTSSISSRKGHHHKHSLSHNFFSFLEPGANLVSQREEAMLHTQPAPTPVSPWMKASTVPDRRDDKSPTFSSDGDGSSTSLASSPVGSSAMSRKLSDEQMGRGGVSGSDGLSEAGAPAAGVVGLAQFFIGAWMWVYGQQIASLACTGVGYWVVFDAAGVAIGKVVPKWLRAREAAGTGGAKEKVRRPYGNARVETVLMFAQAVYLMFSSVYVCKESVEHVLLSARPEGEGGHHHHHRGETEDGLLGIEFPIFLLFTTLISLAGTALFYDNHARLVNVTDNRIPSFSALFRFMSTQKAYHVPPSMSQPWLMLSNPYIVSPLFFCVLILFVALFTPPSQHEIYDLLVAVLITIITFNIAYRACSVLGTVLLQTAPARGLPGGKMESFLRAMREVEQHPQVLHLPAPHFWQLTPTVSAVPGRRTFDGSASQEHTASFWGHNDTASAPLVVTIEVHVEKDLEDDDVLKLTKWVWEKCMIALGGIRAVERSRDRGTTNLDSRGEGPEVTVGIVRG
ncbi:hypothetical protein AMATHDRAFT_70259 [Amanita thiersii Skay4041]|uniref:Uncharacterized protein n=1 Tax=Amanita thiersii Skay4041 TaxID=703135 RepID=A0A2A9NEW2_9AGAR|nr:hypothetical protein AMATHDRAFT_70259 [Amanita thiersii Skay4041]